MDRNYEQDQLDWQKVQDKGTESADFQMHITKGEIFKALSDFQGKCEHPKKTATNPFYKSKYAPLDSCMTANQELLTKCGLSIMQFPVVEGEGQTRIGLVTILAHNCGDYIQGRYLVKAEKETPQSLGSAITYLRRYSYCAVLGLAAEDDDDANAASQVIPKKGSIRNKPSVAEEKPAALKQIHTQKAIETKLKEISTIDGLSALWIECTPKQQENEKIKSWFSMRKAQIQNEATSQTEYETGLFPDIVKVIKHINSIDSKKHLQNWYAKHLPDIQKLEPRDYELISQTIDTKLNSFKN